LHGSCLLVGVLGWYRES